MGFPPFTRKYSCICESIFYNYHIIICNLIFMVSVINEEEERLPEEDMQPEIVERGEIEKDEDSLYNE